MQLYETMVNNQGVHIHVTEVHRDLRNEQTSLVVIPGLSESAEDYIAIMEKLSPIIRGVKPQPGLSLEAVEQYKLALPQAIIVAFEEHDHNIFEPDVDVFVRTADSFLKRD